MLNIFQKICIVHQPWCVSLYLLFRHAMFFVVEHDAQIVANIPRRVRLLSHCNFQHNKVRLLQLLLLFGLLDNRLLSFSLLLFVGCSSLRRRRRQLRGIEIFDIFRTHSEKVLSANTFIDEHKLAAANLLTTYFVSLKSIL